MRTFCFDICEGWNFGYPLEKTKRSLSGTETVHAVEKLDALNGMANLEEIYVYNTPVKSILPLVVGLKKLQSLSGTKFNQSEVAKDKAANSDIVIEKM